MGIPLFIVQRLVNNDDDGNKIFSAIYCLIIILWATGLLEHWKRREGQFAVQWGQLDFEQDEVSRPTFWGHTRRSPVDDNPNEVFFSKVKRTLREMQGFFVSAFIICLVIGCVAAILFLRKYLTDHGSSTIKPYASTITSIINAVQILIFNTIYQWLARYLTNYENHRTQTEFERSLIAKTL